MLIAGCGRAERVSSDTGSETELAASQTPATEPVRVLVIGDGFLRAHESWFVKDILPKVRVGFEMLPGASAEAIRIEYVYLASMSEVSPQTRLGLTYVEGDQANCYFTNREAMLPEVYKHKQDVKDFSPNRYVVILAGNGNGACAMNDVMFVRENVGPDIIAHEMGHSLAGLMDEYTGSGMPDQCIRWRNCSTLRNNPPWTSIEGVDPQEGCDHYAVGIYRPTIWCRMENPSRVFCEVCSKWIKEALATQITFLNVPADGGCTINFHPRPWLLASSAKQGVDVVAIVGTGNQITVLDAMPSGPAALQPQVVTGDLFLTAFRGNTVVGAASIATDRKGFSSRSYAIDQNGRDIRVEDNRALVHVTLYGLSMREALSADLTFGLRRVTNAKRTFWIDDTTIAALKNTIKAPTVGLREQLQPFVMMNQ